MMKRSMCRSGLLLAIFAMTLVVCGCAGKNDSDRVQLTGKVSYKGNPVTGGDVTLHPMSPSKGTPTNLKIGADGILTITGVDPGEYKMVINTDSVKAAGSGPAPSLPGKGSSDTVKAPPSGMPQPPKDLAGSGSGPKIESTNTSKQPVFVAIPTKYKAVGTTPLTITLVKGKQEKDFELVD